MEMELNDRDLAILLVAIGRKLTDSEDSEFDQSLIAVATFATKLLTTVVIGASDSREDALNGVKSAFADCDAMVNKAYDALEALKDMKSRSVN